MSAFQLAGHRCPSDPNPQKFLAISRITQFKKWYDSGDQLSSANFGPFTEGIAGNFQNWIVKKKCLQTNLVSFQILENAGNFQNLRQNAKVKKKPLTNERNTFEKCVRCRALSLKKRFSYLDGHRRALHPCRRGGCGPIEVFGVQEPLFEAVGYSAPPRCGDRSGRLNDRSNLSHKNQTRDLKTAIKTTTWVIGPFYAAKCNTNAKCNNFHRKT